MTNINIITSINIAQGINFFNFQNVSQTQKRIRPARIAHRGRAARRAHGSQNETLRRQSQWRRPRRRRGGRDTDHPQAV